MLIMWLTYQPECWQVTPTLKMDSLPINVSSYMFAYNQPMSSIVVCISILIVPMTIGRILLFYFNNLTGQKTFFAKKEGQYALRLDGRQRAFPNYMEIRHDHWYFANSSFSFEVKMYRIQ